MRIYINSIVLAALAVPAWSFQIVMMANYLDNMGGGGAGKPKAKAAWKPGVPAAVPPPPAVAQAQVTPMAQTQQPDMGTKDDAPVLQAMNDLTDTFVQNELATLMALKEISSSMKILAEVGLGGAPPKPADPQPVASSTKSVVLPPPMPAMPSREEVTSAPEPAPEPAPVPSEPVEFSGSSAWGVTPSSGGSYLDNIAGEAGPRKPSSFMPTFKSPPKAASAGTGSYLDAVGSASPADSTPTPVAPAPADVAPIEPVANPFKAAPVKPSPVEADVAPIEPVANPFKAAPVEPSPVEPSPVATTPAEPAPPGPTPPQPAGTNEKSKGFAVNLGLTFFGIGLLFALAGGGGDYIKSQIDLPSLVPTLTIESGQEDGVGSEAVSSDTVVVPEAAAPGSPAAPEQPVPGEMQMPDFQNPMKGIFERILGATRPSDSEEAAPAEAVDQAVPDEASIPVPEDPAPAQGIYEKVMGIAPEETKEAEEEPAAKEAEEELAAAQKAEEDAAAKKAADEAAAQKVEEEAAGKKASEETTAKKASEEAAAKQAAEEATAKQAAEEAAAKEAAAKDAAAKEAAAKKADEEAAAAVAAAAKKVAEEATAATKAAEEAAKKAAGAAAVAGAATATAPAAAAAAKTGSTFSYDPSASNGPSDWSTLAIEGNECAGKKQSPIAITPSACNVGANYKMETKSTCSVSDLDYALGRGGPKASFPKQCGGTTIQIPLLQGVYEAVQFHTHIGSEHIIGGKRAGAELHIVHKEQGGNRFAVVGVMVNGDGAVDNPTFERLLEKWTAVENKVAAGCDGKPTPTKNRPFVSDSTFNVYDLVPLGSSFYHYDGSLTTPPCSEVVWWEVADTPLSVSAAQYDKLVKMTTTHTDPTTCEVQTAASPLDGSTNRPVAQDLSGRSVQRVCPVDKVAPGLEAPLLVSSIGGGTVLAEAVPMGPAANEQAAPNLVASTMAQSLADDYDPYAGL